MKRHLLILLIVPFVLMGCNKEENPETKTRDFKNDNYTAGGSAKYQLGFEKNEIAASTFGPLVNPFTVQNVSFLFGGNTESRDIILHIYEDNGTSTPGATVYSKTYTVVGSDQLQSLDLSAENIRFEKGSFRVGIQMTQAGAPSLATDDVGSVATNKNWVKVNAFGTWKANVTMSINGNWIIRSSVKEEI